MRLRSAVRTADSTGHSGLRSGDDVTTDEAECGAGLLQDGSREPPASSSADRWSASVVLDFT